MHPFGGTQICPRCSKAVYAAEQVMGPGRKLYHKPCLACTICSKRLDSFTLLEHDQKPYCKACHVKNFGTRDLRQANLPAAPYREDPVPSHISPPSSPIRNDAPITPPRLASPVRKGAVVVTAPRLKPNRSLATSPISFSFPRVDLGNLAAESKPQKDTSTAASDVEIDAEEERDTVDLSSPHASLFPISRPPSLDSAFSGTPSNTGRSGHGGFPRTVPLSPTRNESYGIRPRHITSKSVDSVSIIPPALDRRVAGIASRESEINMIRGETEQPSARPVIQTATGTRYGAALGGAVTVQSTGGGSPRTWGASTPTCPRCGKNVYFAEQVKAVGKTFHKSCLRCMECNTSLDSSRLRDHDGEPLCMRCYGKLHGPQGGGYALLGKAGG